MLAAIGLALSACSAKMPETEKLLDAPQVGPIAQLQDGKIRFGERLTGAVWDVDLEGNKAEQPVATVDIGHGGRRGLLDMHVDDQGRTFVSYVDKQDDVVVSQVGAGDERVVWRGPKAAPDNIGGALTMTPNGRLVIALGDMQRGDAAANDAQPEGKVLTLAVDGTPDQRPNIISRGWMNPGGATYDRNGHLWIADGGQGKSRLARAGESGPTGTVTELGDNVAPSALIAYGDQELIVCKRNTKKLDRFFVNDGTEAIPGRPVADDCAGGVADTKEGRVVYATDTMLRATSK